MISDSKVEKLVCEELKKAIEKYGKYLNSNPEKYAVLKEEIEEADYEINSIKNGLNLYWGAIRGNASEIIMKSRIRDIRVVASKCIKELVQVMAMCDKEIKK